MIRYQQMLISKLNKAIYGIDIILYSLLTYICAYNILNDIQNEINSFNLKTDFLLGGVILAHPWDPSVEEVMTYSRTHARVHGNVHMYANVRVL